jgi:hypothetical protein
MKEKIKKKKNNKKQRTEYLMIRKCSKINYFCKTNNYR